MTYFELEILTHVMKMLKTIETKIMHTQTHIKLTVQLEHFLHTLQILHHLANRDDQ